MASNKALNDDEVHTEMRKMIAFIKQEAVEKAREIKVKVPDHFEAVKADEEFNIEKAKLVRHEAIAIDAAFERKVKQADVQRRIAQSNSINKSRLTLLVARQQMLDELFAQARTKLLDVTKDEKRYSKFMADALLQAAYRLLEPEIAVQYRQADKALLDKILPDVKARYEKETGQTVNIELINDDYLPADGAGGVVVSAHGGRIKCNNTPEARLAILEEEMLPQIRTQLFGNSPNRKFFN
ncbi:V-ATPase V1 sector subunit E [Actinomortierella wolfii]|nr:V-ATPase V1 sector subunit E [Actinomortierella wolfii]